MKSCVLGSLAALTLFTGAAHAADCGSCAAEVQALDAELNRVIIAGDAAKAAPFYAPEFVLTTAAGSRKFKADMLREIAKPGLHFDANETREVQVRTRGDTAVLTAVLHQKGALEDKTFDVELRVTDTWVRGGEHGWQLLAGQANRVAAPVAPK